jgi:hypothetical protein
MLITEHVSVRFSLPDPVPQGSHHGLRAGHVPAAPLGLTEAVIKGNQATFLVADSGGATATTRGLNGRIPARADNLNQYTATLVEWHDLVERTSFNLFASQGDGRAIMQRTSQKVINRKTDQDILGELRTPPTPRAPPSPLRSRW